MENENKDWIKELKTDDLLTQIDRCTEILEDGKKHFLIKSHIDISERVEELKEEIKNRIKK
jgi:hypothetical protein